MDALLNLIIGVLAGCAGAGLVLLVRGGRAVPEPPPAVTVRPVPADPWSPALRRCEQAVHRAGQAVEAISSRETRNRLQAVVRRMDAELPDVRVLSELGKGLGDSRREVEIADRVRVQLADTAARFAEITAELLDLVAEPDDVGPRVALLRDGFPLVRPLSRVLAEPAAN